MKFLIRISAVFMLLACIASPVRAQSTSSGVSWPREFDGPNGKMTIYTPQIESWKDQRELTGWMAVNLQIKGEDAPLPGAIYVSAKTTASPDNKLVELSNFQVQKVNFPDADDETSSKILNVVRDHWVDKTVTMEASRITSQLEKIEDAVGKTAEVQNKPPKVFTSTEPAILVQFDGAPALAPLADSGLLYALNTNWDVIVDTTASKVYLLNGKDWLYTTEIEKPNWQYLREPLSANFNKIPADDDNWTDVRAAVPAKYPAADAKVPKVLISYSPAELILFNGAPQMKAIPGTNLMSLSNTESDLLYYQPDKTYYFLVAGRWFSSKSLDNGEWTYATPNLPADFAKIPANDPMARVLASVPGTDEAKNAVVMANMPKVATVDRGETTFTVQYAGGTPKWKPVAGADGVSYAVNSSINVLMTDAKYYCVSNGVWYMADNPEGPWSYCDNVPSKFYDIPASEPTHSVTYVKVYDRTPTTIVYGYTDGYQGSYISNGTVVYGSGYYYDPFFNNVLSFGLGLLGGYVANEIWHDNHPYYVNNWNWWHGPHHYPWWGHPPCYMPYYGYSYGFGAAYNPWNGGWCRRGYAYGPYGGFGCGARYNPATGRYSRGYQAYGPFRNTYGASMYNPRNDAFGSFRGGSGPYGSWNSAYVSKGDRWMQAGRVNDVHGFRDSAGGKGVWGETGGFITDRNGNHYIKTDDGWNKYDGKTWSRSKTPPTNIADRRPGLTGSRIADSQFGSGHGVRHGAGGAGVLGGGSKPANRPDNMFVGKDGQLYRQNGKNWQAYGKDGRWNNALRPTSPEAGLPGQKTRPGANPALSHDNRRPGQTIGTAGPSVGKPGEGLGRPGAKPGEGLTRPGALPGQSTRPGGNPALSHDNRRPGQTIGTAGPSVGKPGEGLGRPGAKPGEGLTRPGTKPGEGQTIAGTRPGKGTGIRTDNRPQMNSQTMQNLQRQSQVRQSRPLTTPKMERNVTTPRQPSVQRSMPTIPHNTGSNISRPSMSSGNRSFHSSSGSGMSSRAPSFGGGGRSSGGGRPSGGGHMSRR